MSSKWNIHSGPNADRIFDSLKYAFSSTRIPAIFQASPEYRTIKGPVTFTLVITCVGYESGAEGMLVFTGVTHHGLEATGFYDATRRTGFLYC